MVFLVTAGPESAYDSLAACAGTSAHGAGLRGGMTALQPLSLTI